MLGFVKKRHVSITIIVLLVVLTFTRFSNPLFLPLFVALLAAIAYAILRTIFRMRKRRPVIAVMLGLVFIWVIVLEIQNFTGFCRAEWKYLTDEELIQRAAGKIYEENPYCCEVYKKTNHFDKVDLFINKLTAYYIYGLYAYYPDDELRYPDRPYAMNIMYIDSCGEAYWRPRSYLTEKSYKSTVYWIKERKNKSKREEANGK